MGSVTQFPETPTFIDAFERWRETHRTAVRLHEALASEEPLRAREAFSDLLKTLQPLGEAIFADADRTYCHGVALGLMYADRPSLVFDFPERVRKHVATMSGTTGADLRRYVRQMDRPQRRS